LTVWVFTSGFPFGRSPFFNSNNPQNPETISKAIDSESVRSFSSRHRFIYWDDISFSPSKADEPTVRASLSRFVEWSFVGWCEWYVDLNRASERGLRLIRAIGVGLVVPREWYDVVLVSGLVFRV